MKWGLYPKMLLAFLGLAIVPIVLIGSFLYIETKSALTDEAYSKLEAVRDAKKATVTQHIDEKFLNLEALADNERVQQAFAPLTKQFADGGLANDTYQQEAKKFDTYFNQYIEQFGFYDVFFIDPDGNVVYTAFKEPDLGQNVVTGDLKSSGLGKAYQDALTQQKGVIADYAYYEPSKAPAAFFAIPYVDPGTNQPRGVLALQLDGNKINKIMKTTAGLGKTGESYLVGADQRLRSDFRATKQTEVGEKRIQSTPVKQVIAGKTNTTELTDTDGHEVVTSFTPLQLAGLNWGLITEVHTEEVFAALSDFVRNLVIALVILIVLVSLAAILFTRTLVRPIRALLHSAGAIAEHDLSQPVVATSRDEIGQLSRLFETMRLSLIGLVKRVDTMSRTIDDSLAELVVEAEETGHGTKEMAHAMTGIAATAQQQSGAFDGHTASLQSLTATIEQTAQTSALVVDSASRSESLATTGRSDLHAVTEQMQSIQNAIDEAADKSRRVQTASQNILEIISIIESIANETNLLSLNASIEAARAGEQGKGFVVVAREIQNLANQSKQSMGRVQETIDSIQRETKQLEDAMARGTIAVQDGVVRVTEATQSFDSIVTQSKGVTVDMSALSETNRDVLSTASHLVAQAEQLRAGIIASAQDNQHASEQSLAFSERMDVVHTLTEEIYTLSRELHETINRYTLD